MPPMEWTLKPGDTIIRKDLHLQFGGRKQGGIGPSRQSPNVFLFTDPVVGERHGYIDSWKSDGCYHYTGEGQRGDQEMRSGNASILNHKRDGRTLRLFRGVGGTVRYEGRFEVAEEQPFYITDAPETGVGQRPLRAVIVFRLRPLDGQTSGAPVGAPPPTTNMIDEVPPEASQTERFFVEPDREPYEAERREARLVLDFCAFLERQGQDTVRLRIVPEGEAKPLFCDLYVKPNGLLIEAKGTVERGAIRMALGQLLDYGRFVNAKMRALLLPSIPRADLLALIHSANVGVYFPSGDGTNGFAYLAPRPNERQVNREMVVESYYERDAEGDDA